ncbi:glycosyltransferase family 1 protein [Desulfovibrio aerotolerans]|uniref:Glycosyltransferase family 1 protein n=1 Tax=Solidesulfovibrio aerotolerans TaxID=295255 RepID=A0A7C9N0V2_9BACT|nr:glycosyltransferase family 1 protein [Solidesulfovibrio aerotolerans]MYL83577.1 glycosyltransferase family 1 protein [Solidesulfovibrio aerotolerans]
MKKRTIIVSGLAATYPLGGVAWDYIQYLHGFYRLGHDVYYLEDTGGWAYDPFNVTFVDDLTYHTKYLGDFLQRLHPGMEKRFCVIGPDERHWGMSAEELAAVVNRADVFFNISTTCQLRDAYAKIPVKVLIDSDPLYTQSSFPSYLAGTATEEEKRNIANMLRHDVFFSFGENVGRDFCAVPKGVIDWLPTRQPIVLESWAGAAPKPGRDAFTTVLSWQPAQKGPLVAGVQYGGKNLEFEKMLDLPQKTEAVLELALGGGKPPRELLEEKGWKLRDGFSMSQTPWVYRDYIWDSLAEFSTAKNAYVATTSGWFSCRTACYLASGRPAVVQDTGYSRFMEVGEGVVAFTSEAEALAGIEAVRADWDRHSAAARTFAARYFDSDMVLAKLLADALA